MTEGFVWPGNGIDDNTPVWGHRDGIHVGLAPTRGPRGLLRIYTPYLDQEFPRMVNYISFEPTVVGNERRSQSELAASKATAGADGLDCYPSDSREAHREEGKLPTGVVAGDGASLTLFVHTEAFPDGAEPIVEVRFNRHQPHEIELATFASSTSAPMTSCVLSATMGNFGLLHRLHLANGSISADDLWGDDPLDGLDFLPWRTIAADELTRDEHGRPVVTASSDAAYQDLVYDDSVAEHWHYVGKLAAHTWRVEADADPVVAVNARRTYWRSQSPIPGGTAIENFELRTTFVDGQRFWFGVEPRQPGSPSPV